ncbi:MAG: putative two-component system sensor kinase [Frankiales bacterium]|nr:putative two-component system sensor kinase [Frankiales bacterium]
MTRRTAAVLVTVLLVVVLAEVAFGLWTDAGLRDAGRGDLAGFTGPAVALMIGAATAVVVGAVVAVNQPGHPVGWLFIVFGTVIMGAAVIDGYAAYATFAKPGSRFGPTFAFLSDREFVVWFLLLAPILHLTPDGQYLSPRWRRIGRATTAAGAGALLFSIPSTEPLQAPYQKVPNPFGVAALQPWVGPVKSVLVIGLMVGLIAAAGSLVVRFRRSRGDDRRQLLWLAFAVAPMPAFVVLSFAAAYANNDALTLLGAVGFLTLIPIAAGLSVLRFRLYDVERVLSATTTYALLSVSLVGTYALVVWGGARLGTAQGASPEVTATVGALAAAVLAAPLRRGIQDLVDRRFNRRSYEARRVVAAALAREDAGLDLQALLAKALGDPSLRVAFPAEDGWVGPDGAAAAVPVDPVEDAVDVRRHGRVVARVAFDRSVVRADTVAATAQLASAELDNGRLRAELVRQVDEVTASRQRLAGAQRQERRRIERDLHDGAQQSLLALAFDLQSAHVNGDPERMRAALAAGTTAARDAVRDLRALANGLHPAALADGGLPAALDDLAQHSPVPLHATVTVGERLDPAVEFTAWFVVCEAVVNAQKHAHASRIEVCVEHRGDELVLRVVDDGHGGANPDGSGLRGMRDRVDVAQGRLVLRSDSTGTCVEAVIPCGL